ncbi:MAG: murein hydrolase activator EnvC family protein, partial [Candidatus Methylomirabilaceae bacterium]
MAAEKRPALSRRILDKREQLKQLNEELDRRRKQATQVARKERQLFEDLDRADRQLKQKGRELRELQEKVRTSTERLQVLQREIRLTQTDLDHLRGLFRRRVRAIYKQGRSGYVRAVLSADDLSHGIRRAKYLTAIANQDQRMVVAYAAALTTLEHKQAALARSRMEFVENQKAVAAKREEILEEQRTKRRLLAMVQEQKKDHLAAIRQLELGARELQDLIGRLQDGGRTQ